MVLPLKPTRLLLTLAKAATMVPVAMCAMCQDLWTCDDVASDQKITWPADGIPDKSAGPPDLSCDSVKVPKLRVTDALPHMQRWFGFVRETDDYTSSGKEEGYQQLGRGLLPYNGLWIPLRNPNLTITRPAANFLEFARSRPVAPKVRKRPPFVRLGFVRNNPLSAASMTSSARIVIKMYATGPPRWEYLQSSRTVRTSRMLN